MLIVFICLLLGAAEGASAQDFPSFDKVAVSPRTVVEYFLLCPKFGLDDQGGLALSSSATPTRSSFEGNKKLLTGGYSAQDFTIRKVTIDIPNAYIKIEGVQNGLEFILTFVYFDRQDKTLLPAFTLWSEGGDGDTYKFEMFQVDAARRWIDITSQLAPELSLADLDTMIRGSPPVVDWEYILPQKGTTVLAIPHMTYEMTESQKPQKEYLLVNSLRDRQLELPWNRKEGRFTKGTVR